MHMFERAFVLKISTAWYETQLKFDDRLILQLKLFVKHPLTKKMRKRKKYHSIFVLLNLYILQKQGAKAYHNKWMCGPFRYLMKLRVSC